jgi:cbb3-type cytochrome oxidase maturation protein
MSVIYIALPVALGLALIAVITFVVLVRGGQFDDLETPPRRILFDDVELDAAKKKNEPN